MRYTLSILVENHAGVLSKITGLFSRRAFNIDSLAVGVTNDPRVSRITVVANGDEFVVEQLEKQLNKLIPVIKVKRLAEGEFISRELSLIKVHSSQAKRFEIIKIAELMGAKILDASDTTVSLEFTGSADNTSALLELLRPYGIREIVRTGTIAMEKGASVTK